MHTDLMLSLLCPHLFQGPPGPHGNPGEPGPPGPKVSGLTPVEGDINIWAADENIEQCNMSH